MNVLIVDDEPLAREELRFIVAEDDRVTFVDTAESVDEALEKMLDVKPTVIFLDIHLTNESGFDLAKKYNVFKIHQKSSLPQPMIIMP